MSAWLTIFAISCANLISVDEQKDFRLVRTGEGKIIGIDDRTPDGTRLDRLVEIHADEIESVKSVSIRMRAVQSSDIMTLSKIPSLEYLEIGDHPDSVRFDEEAAKTLGVLKGLRSLSVYTSSSPQTICSSISVLPNLNHLYLSFDSDAGTVELPNMTLCKELESLAIEGDVRLIKRLNVQDLPHLTSISLNLQSIDSSLIDGIIGCKNLEAVSVHGYTMNSEVLEKFATSTSLGTIRHFSVSVDSDFIFQGSLLGNVQYLGVTCTEEIDFPLEFFKRSQALKSAVIRGIRAFNSDSLSELLDGSEIDYLIIYPLKSPAPFFSFQRSQNKR